MIYLIDFIETHRQHRKRYKLYRKFKVNWLYYRGAKYRTPRRFTIHAARPRQVSNTRETKLIHYLTELWRKKWVLPKEKASPLYPIYYKYILYWNFIIRPYIKKITIYQQEFILLTTLKRYYFLLMLVKKHTPMQFNYLSDIVVSDIASSKGNVGWKRKKRARFILVYHLFSIKYANKMRIKLELIDNKIPVLTLFYLWKSAKGLEREIWELFGIFFYNHPDLRRQITDYSIQGYPLRKEYPVIGFLEFFYDITKNIIISKKITNTEYIDYSAKHGNTFNQWTLRMENYYPKGSESDNRVYDTDTDKGDEDLQFFKTRYYLWRKVMYLSIDKTGLPLPHTCEKFIRGKGEIPESVLVIMQYWRDEKYTHIIDPVDYRYSAQVPKPVEIDPKYYDFDDMWEEPKRIWVTSKMEKNNWKRSICQDIYLRLFGLPPNYTYKLWKFYMRAYVEYLNWPEDCYYEVGMRCDPYNNFAIEDCLIKFPLYHKKMKRYLNAEAIAKTLVSDIIVRYTSIKADINNNQLLIQAIYAMYFGFSLPKKLTDSIRYVKFVKWIADPIVEKHKLRKISQVCWSWWAEGRSRKRGYWVWTNWVFRIWEAAMLEMVDTTRLIMRNFRNKRNLYGRPLYKMRWRAYGWVKVTFRNRVFI